MWYPEELVEEVRARNDIVDVISQYVKLKRAGSSYVGLCPFHNEKTPSFSVSQSKQFYHCFGCGIGGNVFSFLMQYENYSFQEAVKVLADRSGVALPTEEESPEARRASEKRQILLEVNKAAAGYFYYQLKRENGKHALSYLKGRGLSDETIRNFGLGYADKYSNDLYKYLKNKNYSDEILKDSGLFIIDEKKGMIDKFWNRVMFPIMDTNSRVIGFGGRVMGDGKPKYLNSPETMIFDKSRNLYGLNIARTSRSRSLILCEGYMDVITMHQAGFKNAVASLGTAFTSGHASLVRRYAEEALLLYDSDEAGIRAAQRAIPILRETGIQSRVVHLEPYKDPDEFIKAEGAEAFAKRLEEAEDSFLFRIHVAEKSFRMDTPQGQNRFFDTCAEYLLEMSDELERSLYIEAIIKEYGKTGITADDLRRRVGVRAMSGTPYEPHSAPKNTTKERKQNKRDNASDLAQKLLLTWLVNYPGIYDDVKKYVRTDDFVTPLYREVAEILYRQAEEGDMNPGKLLNHFQDAEEQTEVAALFHTDLVLKTEEEQSQALADTILRIRTESLAKKNSEYDPSDIAGLQELINEQKELENLSKNKEALKIRFPQSGG